MRKKTINKALSLILTLMMVCGMTMMPVFADTADAVVETDITDVAEVSNDTDAANADAVGDADTDSDADVSDDADGVADITADAQDMTESDDMESSEELSQEETAVTYEVNSDETVVIKTADDLAAMTDGQYILGDNISIDASQWTPVSNFTGTFDGNKSEGFAITWTGSSVQGSSNFAIIGTNAGTVRNLKVDGILTVTGSNLDYISGIVGYNKANSVIDNVESSVTLDASGCYNVGGVAGWNDGYILNSINNAAVTGYSQTGGITGQNNGTINSCSNVMNVTAVKTGKGGVGGIAGRNGDKEGTVSAHIWNCYNTSPISASDGSWVAGICGFLNNQSDCTNCYNTGEITGHAYRDNISGNTEGVDNNCYGLKDLEGPQGYDKAILVTIKQLNGDDTISEAGNLYILPALNTGTPGRWAQDTGSYPYLNGTATTMDTNPAQAVKISHTDPAKTEYHEGECFNPAGLVVTATYPDGTSVTVSESDYTFTPDTTTPLKTTDTKITVTGKFTGTEFTFDIPVTVTVIGIDVRMDSKPTQTSYNAGEEFNTSGMKIIATDPSIPGEVELTDYALSKTGPLTGTDKVETVYGEYKGFKYSYDIDISVERVSETTLGGTGVFSTLTDALDAVTSGGSISVLGTVSVDEAMTRNDSVTILRTGSFTGPTFLINAADGIVTLTSMVFDNGGSDTIFQVNSGTLRLRGNVAMKNCNTAVDVQAGGAVTVNKAQITADAYSVKLASATEDTAAGIFNLEDYGGTSIIGKVYLASGTYITANAAIPCALTVESAVTVSGTVIVQGTDKYTLTDIDCGNVELTSGYLWLDGNAIKAY